MKKQSNVNRKPGEAKEYYAGIIQLDGKETRVLFTEAELQRPKARAIKQPEDFPAKSGLGIFAFIKKILPILIMCLTALVISGCSHNIGSYSDGIGFETTFRPDSGNFGFIFRYGKIFNFTARENSEAEMGGSGGADTGEENGNVAASSESNLRIKIGPQTTGYDRDIILALKDHPDAIKAFYEAKNRVANRNTKSTDKQNPKTPNKDDAVDTEEMNINTSDTTTPRNDSDETAIKRP